MDVQLEEGTLICLMKFGSHLYGTNTPDSDTDYKGIYLPSKRQILLGNIPKSVSYNTNNSNEKNEKDDVDCEIYSLHYFLKLAMKGETAAIDMLHCPDELLEVNSEIWQSLRGNRGMFYTRNLHAFVGYARRQAAKYGIKGSRIAAAEYVIERLTPCIGSLTLTKLSDVWDSIHRDGEHVKEVEPTPNGIRQIMVCGKILQETVKIPYAISILENFVEQYGERAKLARENKGVDWKAVSHAMRAAYQLQEIYMFGDITFPLACSEHLKQIKQGLLDYTTVVAPVLENAIDKVGKLAEESKYPKQVDKKYWEVWLMNWLERTVFYNGGEE